MNILWMCDVVLPEFSDLFGIKKTVFGGWMSGALRALKIYQDIHIGLCFPIIDDERMKDGSYCGYSFYSFKFDVEEQRKNMNLKERFMAIIDDFQPDIIHIWGTEYVHSLMMIEASREKMILDRVIVYIQGLVSIYAKHYLIGIPNDVSVYRSVGFKTLCENRQVLIERGKNEVLALTEAHYIAGRTNWDKACAFEYNPMADYCYMREILRAGFYAKAKTWNYQNCIKHQIFISQANYPIKGFHFMIEALDVLKRSFPDVIVRIGGEDVLTADELGNRSPYGDYLHSRISQLNLTENVCFLGRLDEEEIIREYQDANVSVSCSTIENSSNSICEALLIGTPVVASYVGGTPDIIEHGKNGFLYDVNEPYMLAYYVGQLFRDEEKCQYLSSQAYEKIIKFVDPIEVAIDIKNIYEKINGLAREKI